MSDGNYNRNLLPYRDYPSGVRAGRAAMRTLALAAFERVLARHIADEAERCAAREAFRAELFGK